MYCIGQPASTPNGLDPMTRRLVPLAALGLLPAPAFALPCPPPVWWGPPVVIVHPPRQAFVDPCWCPPVPLAAPALAAPKPTEAKPADPKPAPPQVKVEPTAPKPQPEAPAAPPFKPVVPAADKPDPPTMPPLVIPQAPAPKPAAPTPAAPPPGDPTAPKGLDLKPVNPAAPEVPPLTLPPPPKETKTSYRLPAPARSARLIPAAGPAPADPTAPRKVVFVNLSRSAVVLTVGGETAVLPARHELTATVPARFRWRLDGGDERTAELPADAPGAEVVIR